MFVLIDPIEFKRNILDFDDAEGFLTFINAIKLNLNNL